MNAGVVWTEQILQTWIHIKEEVLQFVFLLLELNFIHYRWNYYGFKNLTKKIFWIYDIMTKVFFFLVPRDGSSFAF